MKNEKQKTPLGRKFLPRASAQSWSPAEEWRSNSWCRRKADPSLDQEYIVENAVDVERSVRDVIKRPRYFQLTKAPDRLSDLIQWTVPSNLASGASDRHPYRGNHGQ